MDDAPPVAGVGEDVVEAVARAIDPRGWRWFDTCTAAQYGGGDRSEEGVARAKDVFKRTAFTNARAAIAAMSRQPVHAASNSPIGFHPADPCAKEWVASIPFAITGAIFDQDDGVPVQTDHSPGARNMVDPADLARRLELAQEEQDRLLGLAKEWEGKYRYAFNLAAVAVDYGEAARKAGMLEARDAVETAWDDESTDLIMQNSEVDIAYSKALSAIDQMVAAEFPEDSHA